jgi:hypothetical protein
VVSVYFFLAGSPAFFFKVPRTFFCLFFLSFLFFRLVFSTLVARPDCGKARCQMLCPKPDRCNETHPDKSVLGLELLLGSLVIVDETETGRSTTTELGL